MNVVSDSSNSKPHSIHSQDELAAKYAELERKNRMLAEENSRLKEKVNYLTESELRLRRLIDANIIGVVIFDADGWLLEVNAAFLSIIGRTPADFILEPLHCSKLVAPASLSNWAQAREQLQATAMAEPWETEVLHPDGNAISLLMGATLLQSPAGNELITLRDWGFNKPPSPGLAPGEPAVMAFAVDLTAQKRAAEELRASEERMRAIVEGLHEGLLITDLDDTILYCNHRMEELSGYSAEEMLGSRAYELLLAPSHRAVVHAQNERRVRGESNQYELPERRKNGESWWALINGSPLRDGQGRIVGTIGAHSDITEKKHAEARARRFAARLEESNRDLQALAYAVSHDLKEPLRKIQNFGQHIEQRAANALDGESLDYLRRMRSAASQVSGLIDGLLELSRIMTGSRGFHAVDLNQVAKESVAELQIQLEATDATIHLGKLPTVSGDRDQLRQLLYQLFENAIVFRRPNAKLRVDVSTWSNAHEHVIRVTDNGGGFDGLDSERIFEVFTRLSTGTEKNAGVGVGLTLCRKIVERHGGRIEAQGEPGIGATFTIHLPRYLAA